MSQPTTQSSKPSFKEFDFESLLGVDMTKLKPEAVRQLIDDINAKKVVPQSRKAAVKREAKTIKAGKKVFSIDELMFGTPKAS